MSVKGVSQTSPVCCWSAAPMCMYVCTHVHAHPAGQCGRRPHLHFRDLLQVTHSKGTSGTQCLRVCPSSSMYNCFCKALFSLPHTLPSPLLPFPLLSFLPHSPPLPPQVPESTLHKDIGEVLRSGSFSDVTLRVGEKQFRAHKVILACRSPVFGAMFEHEMKESRRVRMVGVRGWGGCV